MADIQAHHNMTFENVFQIDVLNFKAETWYHN